MAEGLSLHIGVNEVDPRHYNGWVGTLRACEYDAGDMRQIAEERGFSPSLLLTAEATAEAVTGAIAAAAGQLAAGDIFLLTYAGHGGQVPDTNSDDEADGKDETWVLFDRQLVDDELHSLFGRFAPGVRILVLSDSCHSGSVTRGIFDMAVPHVVEMGMVDEEQPKTRDLPADVQEATYRAHEGLYRQIQESYPSGEKAEIGASVLLISGCQDNQLSLDGKRNGLFTQNVRGVWDEGRFHGFYPSFWREIAAKMPPVQSPNYFKTGRPDEAFERQVPFTI